MLCHASEQLVRTYTSVLQESLAEEIIAFPSLLRNCGSHMRQHDCWLKQKIALTFPNVEVAQRVLSLFIFSVVQLQWPGFAVTVRANKERVVFENGTVENSLTNINDSDSRTPVGVKVHRCLKSQGIFGMLVLPLYFCFCFFFFFAIFIYY